MIFKVSLPKAWPHRERSTSFSKLGPHLCKKKWADMNLHTVKLMHGLTFRVRPTFRGGFEEGGGRGVYIYVFFSNSQN